MQLSFISIKTRPFLPPKDDIYDLLDSYLPPLQERDILFIASKILAIHQGRTIPANDAIKKEDLIIREAEQYISREDYPNPYDIILTIKEHTLIPSAGIDESNANGYYVLWPERINEAAKEIRHYLEEKHNVKHIAVIITDSHTIPMRRGVMGISIGFSGLNPTKDYRGKPDIFGRELKVTLVDSVDSLAAFGVFLMGEGNEQTPLLLFRDVENIEFTDKDNYSDLVIPQEEDLYSPLLRVFQKPLKDDVSDAQM